MDKIVNIQPPFGSRNTTSPMKGFVVTGIAFVGLLTA
jgi:hypothetical protein